MDYQGVNFNFDDGECKLQFRAVTGTQGRNKSESIVKMLDIIDDLTGIEGRPMKAGDLLIVDDKVSVILSVSKQLIRTCEDINNVQRDVIVYADGGVKPVFTIGSEAPQEVAVPEEEYKLHSYQDITLKTDSYITNKTVSVWI